MHAGALKGQKGASDPLDAELQAVVSHQFEVPGTDLRSSVRATKAPNY